MALLYDESQHIIVLGYQENRDQLLQWTTYREYCTRQPIGAVDDAVDTYLASLARYVAYKREDTNRHRVHYVIWKWRGHGRAWIDLVVELPDAACIAVDTFPPGSSVGTTELQRQWETFLFSLIERWATQWPPVVPPHRSDLVRHVTTSGGDYAERDIDKRQGVFYEMHCYDADLSRRPVVPETHTAALDLLVQLPEDTEQE